MDFDAKLEGWKGLTEALRALPENIGKNVLRSAVASGAAVVRVEAKKNALAMKVTGTLARSIYQKQIREESGPERQTFYVGARQGKRNKTYSKGGKQSANKDAFYARFVELGHFSTGDHWVPPHPFLRPAFDVMKNVAVDAIGIKISDRLLQIKAKK